MEPDLVGTTLAEYPGSSPRVPSPAAQRTEQHIRQRLAKAEQLIRQQRPAQALALLQAPGAPPRNWPMLWHPRWYLLAGWAMLQCNQPQRARTILEQGLKTLKHLRRRPSAAGQPFLREWRAWLRCFLGASFHSSDQPIQALFCQRQALEVIASAHPDPELVMLICKGMGDAYLSLGAYADAIAFFLLAKQHGQDVHDPHAQGLIEWGLGRAYKFQGNLSQARRAFSRAIDIFEQLEAKPLVSQLRSLLGLVLIWLHRHDEAESLLRQALGGAERVGDPSTRAMALGNLAALHVARGKPEKAIRAVQDGLAILQKTEDQEISGYLYLALAHAFEAQRNCAAAEAALTSAITTFMQAQRYGLLAHVRERYGKFLADQGRYQEAYEQLRLAPRKTAASLAT